MDDKILEILTEIKSEMSEMNNRFDNFEKELSEVKSDVTAIKLYQENVLDKNIQLLAENVSSANTRLISIENDVTALKDNQEIADVLIELGTAFKR